MRLRPELAALVFCALALTPAVASAKVPAGSETASGGSVSATLKWDAGDFDRQNPHLTITRAGVVELDSNLPLTDCVEGDLACLIVPTGKDDLSVRDLDGDGDPEVLVGGFTGGAHCCVTLSIYDFRAATSTYSETLLGFASSGYGLKDLNADGKPELVSDDVRFEDLYTSHAASFPPPQIFDFAHVKGFLKLNDVTRSFPAEIRKNAAEAKKLFKQFKRSDPFPEAGGVVSAYVADQYLLGRGSVGLKELDHQIKTGRLGSKKRAAAFRKSLLARLHRYGYR
jgi:hypothetical protein